MPSNPARDAPVLRACGDTAISVDFGETLDPVLTRHVMAVDAALAEARLPGVVETVPTYRAITVHVDPLVVDMDRLRADILEIATHSGKAVAEGRTWQVPVVLGGGFGIDLTDVADRAGLSNAACIDAFAEPEYTVAMVGFLPGFSYLSGLDPRLAMARRREPRRRVPASSVSIGGQQAAIGSVEGPSGWHLIGRTPVRPFQPSRDPVFLFAPGDRIRFEPVSDSVWDDLDRQAEDGAPVAELVTQ